MSDFDDLRNKIDSAVEGLYEKIEVLINNINEENININRMKIDTFKTIVFALLTYEPNTDSSTFLDELINIVPFVEATGSEDYVDYLNQKVVIYIDHIQFLCDTANF